MRIVLLNPPNPLGMKEYIRSGRWTRVSRAHQSWYPIWLGYCTALLEREGHECLLLDASVEDMNVGLASYKIYTFEPDYIVMYWGYDTWKQDLEFAETCSSMGMVILVSPWSFCYNPLEHSKNVKLMTFGEFEHTVLDVVNGKPYSDITGLIWKDGENIITNEKRPLCSPEEFDRIPFVSEVYKRFLNMKHYRQTSLMYPFIDVQGARGCPFRCIYCVQTRAMQGGSSYRSRSIKNIIEELWWIKQNLPQVKQVFFQDETMPYKHAIELCQSIFDEKLKIYWGTLMRGDANYELLKLMERSGCRTLQVGFETPIQKYLDIINKDITVEQYERFCRAIQKTKIVNNAAFMIFPWMTKDDVAYTVNWAKKMKIDRLSFITAQPYPNTHYAEFVSKRNGLSWNESVELEKWAHKEYYLKNPWMWKQILSKPSKWKDVFIEAVGLLNSLRE